MRRKKRILGVLMVIAALIIMQLPVSEADAATSASDFVMDGSTLVRYRGADKSVSVPDTVEVIGNGAFEDNLDIELVVVPNSVKRIEPYAFWGCENLDTVVLGKGMTEVGDYAFAGCTGLVQMTIPETVASIGIGAFSGCGNLKNIVIPAETTDIQESAFDGCYQLKIHCDKGTAADKYAEAFYERQKEMPEYEDVPGYDPSKPSVSTPQPSPTRTPEEEAGQVLGASWVVGNSAFVFVDNTAPHVYDGREYLETDTSPVADITDDFSDGLAKFTIVDGSVIADFAYYRSSALGSILLPEGVREVGQFAFARSALSGVTLPDGVERICYGAFYHCDYLTGVTLSDTVMYVEPKAFAYTAWVQDFMDGGNPQAVDFLISGGVLVAYRGTAAQVTVPDGVRVIAGEVFENHTEITELNLPDSLKVVGEAAFAGCTGLETVNFGTGVEEILDRAFLGTGIAEGTAVVPFTVKKLGLRAFGSAELIYEGVKPELTHETSAERLSNASYRVYPEQALYAPGVTVQGPEGASASLEGEKGGYLLSITELKDISAMTGACRRTFGTFPPADMTVYELQLTDSSGIALTKLGTHMLTVVLPVPEQLKGQEIRILGLDRNGQPEAVSAERVSVNGTEAVRFQTNHLWTLGLYGAGAANTEQQLMEVSVAMESLSAGPLEEPAGIVVSSEAVIPGKPGTWAGAALLGVGILLILSSLRKRQDSVTG